MSNYIEFTYQHTCSKRNKKTTLKESPFFSPKVQGKNGKWKIPFLGEGYYLWEENIQAAIKWGENYCDNDYLIVEFEDVKIFTSDLFDLTNRRNSRYFKDLRKDYIDEYPQSANWRIGRWIEFFKMMNKKDNTVFPYSFIRADKYFADPIKNDATREKLYFQAGSKYYTYGSPVLFICALDKTKLNFKRKLLINN